MDFFHHSSTLKQIVHTLKQRRSVFLRRMSGADSSSAVTCIGLAIFSKAMEEKGQRYPTCMGWKTSIEIRPDLQDISSEFPNLPENAIDFKVRSSLTCSGPLEVHSQGKCWIDFNMHFSMPVLDAAPTHWWKRGRTIHLYRSCVKELRSSMYSRKMMKFQAQVLLGTKMQLHLTRVHDYLLVSTRFHDRLLGRILPPSNNRSHPICCRPCDSRLPPYDTNSLYTIYLPQAQISLSCLHFRIVFFWKHHAT